MSGLSPQRLQEFRAFIKACSENPNILHVPELDFFKSYIESLGGTVPPLKKMPTEANQEKSEEPKVDEVDSEPESELEFDMEGCIEPDKLCDDQDMGDPNKEPTEEEIDEADEVRRKGIAKMNDGELEEAIKLLTESIKLNPTSAMHFAKRGQAYLKLNKPNACIKDCTRALELNCDSAPAYKFRGRAHRLIGNWEEAARDLRQACRIDFDEQADEWLKEVTPNAHKLEQHKVKQERRNAEKEMREKMERIRVMREAQAKAAESSKGQEEMGEGGMPFDFQKLLVDPEIIAVFQDPEVAAAFSDISMNPANIANYQSNPKVMAVMAKLAKKFQSATGGAMPSGMPGMAGFENLFGGAGGQPSTESTTPTSKPTAGNDMELD